MRSNEASKPTKNINPTLYKRRIDVLIGSLDVLIQVKKLFTKKEGKELATVKVYLNTGIIAGLIGVGYIASILVFGVLILVLK